MQYFAASLNEHFIIFRIFKKLILKKEPKTNNYRVLSKNCT